MKQKLLMLIVGCFLGQRAIAAGYEPLVVCDPVGIDGIAAIEVYRNDGINQVTTYFENAPAITEDLDSDLAISVEVSIPLPKLGAYTRALQWRHTGWAITTYEDFTRHDRVNCQ